MQAVAPPPGTDDPADAARANLLAYAAHAGISPEAPPFAALLQAFA